MTKETITKADPTTVAILWDNFLATSNEMSDLLVRTCQNLITTELMDHHCGIFDRQGRLVASFLALPGGARYGTPQVKDVIKKYGENIHPGDKFIMNCSYTASGTHLPDWTFIKPIFYRDELLFFAFSKAHQIDNGGAFPSGYTPNLYDIHSEGLAMPPTKLFERGKLDKDLYDLILNNIRYRESAKVDHQALFASLDLAEKRCVKLLEKYGKETVLACADKMIETMREVIKRAIEKLPDGTYYGESATDEDGTPAHYGVPVWVRCNVTIAGDTITADFTPSDKQVNFVNSPWAHTCSKASTAIFSVLTPPELAPYINEGAFEPMTIIAPEGSVVNPKYPATVGACPVNVGSQIIESIFMALSQVEPTKARAGWAKPVGFHEFGLNRRGMGYDTAQFNDGGSGAVWGYDGWQAIGRIAAFGALRKGNIEITETRYTWFVRRYELTTDSAGAGKWRGGVGLRAEFQSQCGGQPHAIIPGCSDGDLLPGYAVLGGQTPPLNEQMLIRKRSGKTEKVYSKRGVFFLEDGDIFVSCASGGGGVGSPADRDPELVKMDVLREYVSLEKAKEIYKVILNPETLEIDYEATQKLRASAKENSA